VGFETLWLFRYLELDCDTDAPVNLNVLTDKPGDVIYVKRSQSFNTEDTTTGRRTVRIRFPGFAKGRLLQVRMEPLGVMRLYGARVYAKKLGVRAQWAWYALPVVPTPDLWSTFGIPIPGVQDLWSDAPIPIEGTPDLYASAPIPIPGVSEAWSEAHLPIAPTPEEYASARLPIAPTAEEWGTIRLPIAETPVEGIWVDLPVED